MKNRHDYTSGLQISVNNTSELGGRYMPVTEDGKEHRDKIITLRPGEKFPYDKIDNQKLTWVEVD